MATTTISIRTEAHAALKRARAKGESFSDVILRSFQAPSGTGEDLLAALESLPPEAFDAERLAMIRTGRGRRSARPIRRP